MLGSCCDEPAAADQWAVAIRIRERGRNRGPMLSLDASIMSVVGPVRENWVSAHRDSLKPVAVIPLGGDFTIPP